MKPSGKLSSKFEALWALGKEGEQNGVTVGFGYAGGNTATTVMEGNQVRVTVDWSAVDSATQSRKFTSDEAAVESAGVVAHEGTHVFIDRIYGGGMNLNQIGYEFHELGGFEGQSLVHKAFNSRSSAGLWNSGWARVDEDILRWRAIHSNTERSVKQYLREMEAQH